MNLNTGNSATSGTDVASIGFWPRGILQFVQNAVSSLATTLSGILAGTLNAAALDFTPKGVSDKLSDAQMAEIARRLVVTFENISQGNILLQPDPPTDLTKIWGQTDPTSGVLIGQLKKWDADQKKWIATVESLIPYEHPLESPLARVSAAAGASTHTVSLGIDMGRNDYFLSITPTTWNGTVFGAAPSGFPNPHGWAVSNKTPTDCTIAFYGVPVGGLTYEVWARNPETT